MRSRGRTPSRRIATRSEEHTSELQSPCNLVCRLLLEKKKLKVHHTHSQTRPAIRKSRICEYEDSDVQAVACAIYSPVVAGLRPVDLPHADDTVPPSGV